jgi:hypothetical protein
VSDPTEAACDACGCFSSAVASRKRCPHCGAKPRVRPLYKRRSDAGVKRGPRSTVEEPRAAHGPPWCARCGSSVIWPGPPERCLECRGTVIALHEKPDDFGSWPEDLGFEAGIRRFLRAVEESYRLTAAKRAAEGGKPEQ